MKNEIRGKKIVRNKLRISWKIFRLKVSFLKIIKSFPKIIKNIMCKVFRKSELYDI